MGVMIVAAVSIALMLGVALSFPQLHQQNDLLTVNSVMKPNNLRIFDGNSTTMNTHRYLVGILKDGTFRCAGVIVSASWIVTSADCAASVDASDLTVVTSSTDGVTGKNYTVLQTVVHPDYSSKTLDYDFSCMQVDGTFYYGNRRAHRLPSAAPKENATLMVAGYGCTTSACETRVLRKAAMVWLPKESCNSTYAKYKITEWDRLGCAYSPAGATLCKGDFGDPFVKGEVFYGMFVSALSTGFCTSSALPVIVTDVYAVATWVKNVTGAT